MLMILTGCSKKPVYENERALLNSWAMSIRNKDYLLYRKFEAFPKTQDQFLEMYRDYYPADISVVRVSKPSEEKNDADLNIYVSRTVDFGMNVIMRKDNARVPSLGSVVLIQYRKQPDVWLVADKTIIRSE